MLGLCFSTKVEKRNKVYRVRNLNRKDQGSKSNLITLFKKNEFSNRCFAARLLGLTHIVVRA